MFRASINYPQHLIYILLPLSTFTSDLFQLHRTQAIPSSGSEEPRPNGSFGSPLVASEPSWCRFCFLPLWSNYHPSAPMHVGSICNIDLWSLKIFLVFKTFLRAQIKTCPQKELNFKKRITHRTFLIKGTNNVMISKNK